LVIPDPEEIWMEMSEELEIGIKKGRANFDPAFLT